MAKVPAGNERTGLATKRNKNAKSMPKNADRKMGDKKIAAYVSLLSLSFSVDGIRSLSPYTLLSSIFLSIIFLSAIPILARNKKHAAVYSISTGY